MHAEKNKVTHASFHAVFRLLYTSLVTAVLVFSSSSLCLSLHANESDSYEYYTKTPVTLCSTLYLCYTLFHVLTKSKSQQLLPYWFKSSWSHLNFLGVYVVAQFLFLWFTFFKPVFLNWCFYQLSKKGIFLFWGVVKKLGLGFLGGSPKEWDETSSLPTPPWSSLVPQS